MILVWPLLLVGAVLLARARTAGVGGRGARWSVAWLAAGFVWSFSLLAGLSIGLLLLPLAAAMLFWVASRSPRLPEALGFVAGVAATAAVVAAL